MSFILFGFVLSAPIVWLQLSATTVGVATKWQCKDFFIFTTCYNVAAEGGKTWSISKTVANKGQWMRQKGVSYY